MRSPREGLCHRSVLGLNMGHIRDCRNENMSLTEKLRFTFIPHAQNVTAAWNPPIPNTTFPGNNTMPHATIMTFYRYLPFAISIQACERGAAKHRLSCFMPRATGAVHTSIMSFFPPPWGGGGHVHGRIAAQRGFHPCRNPSTEWHRRR